MSESDAPDIEAEARRILEAGARPRRRARPRVSRALADAGDHTLTTSYGEIAAWRLGEGPAVLLVHGWEDDNSLWGPAIEQFAAWGRPVVALDLPGHGFSPAENASVDSAAESLMAAERTLGPFVAAVGHSYGCAAILGALDKGLSVPRIVLIATPVPRTQPRRPLVIEGVDPAVLARADALRAEHGERQTKAAEETLRTLRPKLLAVHSIDDEQCALSNSQRMVELAPDADLMLVDGLGHRFVAQDDEVLVRVAEFVEGV